MRTMRIRVLSLAASLLAGSTLFQLSGCSVKGVRSFLSSFNPCGTILACDPIEYRFLTSGYRGPGVDPDVDPACVYPPFCPDDPFIGGAAP